MAVKEIYAMVATDPQGNEGVAVIQVTPDVVIPLVAETRDVIEQYRPLAAKIAQTFGKPVWITRFSVRENLESIS